MGYASTYERDLCLEIEFGVVKATAVHVNGVAGGDDASEGYQIGGMSVFPKSKKVGENTP